MQPATMRAVRAEELREAALSFAWFFCVLAAYYVLRPVREQLAAAVGSTRLPVFYAATFLATLALTPLFGWCAVRVPRRVLVLLVYGVFIACLCAFVPLFQRPGWLSPRTLGAVFFVWVSVFNLFVVSLFWSVMADVWRPAQARRWFPAIALGGTAGAIAGPLLTSLLVGVLGVGPLLLVSAALLLVALACAAALGRWANAGAGGRVREAPVAGRMFDGLRQVVAEPFVRNMALLMVLGDCIGTLNYTLVTDWSGAHFHDAVSRTRFAARVDLGTNVLQVLVQLTLTRWWLVRRGAGPVIACWALATAAVLAWVGLGGTHDAAFVGGLPPVALALVVSRGLAYGMAGPARESLFTRVPRALRYFGKNAVDTAVWRAGDVATASTLNLLRVLGVGVPGLALLGAGAALAAGGLGWRLATQAEATPGSGEAA